MRVGVRAGTKMNLEISVRVWSVKRVGVEWQSYKARLLYIVFFSQLEHPIDC